MLLYLADFSLTKNFTQMESLEHFLGTWSEKSFVLFNLVCTELAGSKTQVTFHRSEVQVTVLSIGN